MRHLILIAIGLCMNLPVALAQPSTQPSTHLPDRPGQAGDSRRWMAVSMEEQADALMFMREHMPLLYAMIDDSPPQSPRHRRLVRFAVERYRWISRIQREQPELYPQMLVRLRTQDEVFELVRRYHTSPEEERSAVYQQLRAKVREVTLGIIEERQRRIENLKRMLDREIRALQRDRDNLDAMTEERLERLLGEMRELRED